MAGAITRTIVAGLGGGVAPGGAVSRALVQGSSRMTGTYRAGGGTTSTPSSRKKRLTEAAKGGGGRGIVGMIRRGMREGLLKEKEK